MKAMAALLLALAFLTSGAEAQSRFGIGDVCKFDIEQYCKEIRKARIKALRECLAKHEKQLFPRCQDHYREAK
jgi:hypothetical protein